MFLIKMVRIKNFPGINLNEVVTKAPYNVYPPK